jgi:hypothetical protein
MRFVRRVLGIGLGMLLVVTGLCAAAEVPFGIEVLDEQTGRGVPLVELKTVNGIRYWTDSAGFAAIPDADLVGQEVYFGITSHGYEAPKDGFGFAGVRLKVEPGKVAQVKIKRTNIAERLYRATGAGIYADSLLLGKKPPAKEPLSNAQVAGCDSVQNAVYHGKLFWIWGDTLRVSYPLGNFNASGATTPLPGNAGLAPESGIDLEYFKDDKGFARGMAPLPGEGPTWLTGLVTLKSGDKEELYAGYMKIRPPLAVYEKGLVRFDDARGEFERVVAFPLEAPLWPSGHAVVREEGGVSYVYFGDPFPLMRVPATAAALRDPAQYQAYTCLSTGSSVKFPVLERDAQGKLKYEWRTGTPPLVPEDEDALIRRGKLKRDEGMFRFVDPARNRPVIIHRGTVHWNGFRERWIMVATEIGGSSQLGEVWYSEAESPFGPWTWATKVVTHNRYSFYNPVHHPEFDQEGGKRIYFEGTYTASFSGNEEVTPRYEYNQMMYRLDLSDPRLRPAAG